MPISTGTPAAAIEATLSLPRLSTFTYASSGDTSKALELYAWNAHVSSSLMLPAHFAEVSVRNAVAEVLELTYGPRWPWEPTFELSLPDSRRRFSPRRELCRARDNQASTGKVVAELKFVFWESMFTARYQTRLWNPHLLLVFPNSNAATAATLRTDIYNKLSAIRKLRNRIAHHEPIFNRALATDLRLMTDLINFRCTPTASWVQALEETTGLLGLKP